MIRTLVRQFIFAMFVFAFADNVLAQMPPVRRVTLTYTCEIPAAPPDERAIDLWIPMPSSDERQTIRLLNEGDLRQGRMTTDPRFGNRIYYRRFEGPAAKASAGADIKSGQPRKIQLIYEVEVHEATVPEAKKLISTRQAAPPPEVAQYLGDAKMIPIKGRISELASKIDLPEGEPLRAARQVYDYLVDTMVYNYLAKGAGTGDAAWACDSKTGDCTDYHSVFIGVCRWRDIPADHVFGLPIPPDKPKGDIRYCHCWARFWVADIGWIPIDASRADKFPKDRDYYFGTIGSTWITLSHGRDVVLEPPQQGPPINMFEAPIAEIDGQPFKGVRWQGYYEDLQ